MRQFGAVLFIMVAILLYGRVFIGSPNASQAEIAIRDKHKTVPQPRTDEVTLTFKTGNGETFRAYMDSQETSVFVNGTLAFIEERRKAMHEHTKQDVADVFKRAFVDRDQAINTYADWFYGYFTSAELIGRSLKAVFGELLSFDFDQEKIKEAPQQAVEEAMREKYMSTVLKPELRDPEIQAGVAQIIKGAWQDYDAMLRNIDKRLFDFVADNARLVEKVDPKDALSLKLDWVAESWRAPIKQADEALQFAEASAALMVGSTLLGDVVLETFGGVFTTILADATAASEMAAIGGGIGSIEPGPGTAVGVVVGLSVHGILTLFREKLGREQFVADTQKGLDVTIERWEDLITPNMNTFIDQWFDESKKLVVTPGLEAKLGS